MKEVQIATFPCPYNCGEGPFPNKKSVNMHVARAHTKTILVPNQKKGRTKMSKEEFLRKKREYNRKWRLARGMKVRPRALKEAKPIGVPWTPERRAKFERTWKIKSRTKRKSEKKLEAANQYRNSHVEQTLEDPREYINHCPHCGQSLIAYYLAAGAERRRRGH
jgi:predicted RNA-binding Zn-ribbon protein involved in translation (DUF1610 family)